MNYLRLKAKASSFSGNCLGPTLYPLPEGIRNWEHITTPPGALHPQPAAALSWRIISGPVRVLLGRWTRPIFYFLLRGSLLPFRKPKHRHTVILSALLGGSFARFCLAVGLALKMVQASCLRALT